MKNNGKGDIKRSRDSLVFHFPHYQSADGPHTAIIQGDFKLIHFYETQKSSLFNLETDIGEQNDLTQSNPSQAMQMEKQLKDYLLAVNAQMPRVNPDHDPTKPTASQKRKGRGGKKNRKTDRSKRRRND